MIESVTPTSGGGATLATISDMSPLMRTVNDDTTQAAALTTLGAQPLDTDLTAIAALTSAANKVPYSTGTGTWALADLSAAARTVLDDASVGAMVTTLGAQPLDTDLTAIAALTSAADKLPYATGSGTWALADLSAAARTVLDDASVGAMVTTLGAQPLDTDLTAIAALTSAANKVPYSTGSGTWALADLSAAARTVLDDATVGAMLTTLGAPASADVQTFTSSGTWTKPTGAKSVTVFMWGGGGGGGSGRRGAAATNRGGGGGGAAGGRLIVNFLPADLSATESVTVGTGGAGGALVSTDDTNGTDGADGGASVFKNIRTGVGSKGLGGTTAGGTAGAASKSIVNFAMSTYGAGGDGSIAATGSTAAVAYLHPTGGGGGGGISTANTIYAGGPGGDIMDASTTIFSAGGIGGTTGGGPNAFPGGSNTPHGGNGGGGGAARITTAAGTGAVAGFPSGGGGGGGASLNTYSSGTGGTGGAGQVIVITYF